MELKLEIRNQAGEVLASAEGKDAATVEYFAAYQEGDYFRLTCSETGVYLMLFLDDAMGEEFVYQKTNELLFTIPFGEKRVSYSPKHFYGDCHTLGVRVATAEEIAAYKNLAANRYDQHGDPGCYPHAHANVETRGESVFAARNAINGNCRNAGHGSWPYESWGINMQDDAEITLEFGRTVSIDRMVLVTRADFPHDNYWKQVTFTFSDGTILVHKMEKSVAPHEIPLPEKKEVEWIKMNQLIKDPEDPSPFPALSQWMVFGTEV